MLCQNLFPNTSAKVQSPVKHLLNLLVVNETNFYSHVFRNQLGINYWNNQSHGDLNCYCFISFMNNTAQTIYYLRSHGKSSSSSILILIFILKVITWPFAGKINKQFCNIMLVLRIELRTPNTSGLCNIFFVTFGTASINLLQLNIFWCIYNRSPASPAYHNYQQYYPIL